MMIQVMKGRVRVGLRSRIGSKLLFPDRVTVDNGGMDHDTFDQTAIIAELERLAALDPAEAAEAASHLADLLVQELEAEEETA
jgi:hypothetical protein